MSKKHPVKPSQASARPTKATATPAATRPAARPDDERARPATQAGSASDSGSAAARSEPRDEARARMIAEAAYYLSEQRGFAPGHEVEDWLAAEQQIDSRIAGGRGVMGPMQIS